MFTFPYLIASTLFSCGGFFPLLNFLPWMSSLNAHQWASIKTPSVLVIDFPESSLAHQKFPSSQVRTPLRVCVKPFMGGFDICMMSNEEDERRKVTLDQQRACLWCVSVARWRMWSMFRRSFLVSLRKPAKILSENSVWLSGNLTSGNTSIRD